MAIQPAVVSPTFQPAMRIISGITNANPASITTTFAHNYETGEIVRFDIPIVFGMQQINQQTGTITVTSPTTFTVNINTTFYDLWADPGTSKQFSQVVSIGEDTLQIYSATENVLPSGTR